MPPGDAALHQRTALRERRPPTGAFGLQSADSFFQTAAGRRSAPPTGTAGGSGGMGGFMCLCRSCRRSAAAGGPRPSAESVSGTSSIRRSLPPLGAIGIRTVGWIEQCRHGRSCPRARSDNAPRLATQGHRPARPSNSTGWSSAGWSSADAWSPVCPAECAHRGPASPAGGAGKAPHACGAEREPHRR